METPISFALYGEIFRLELIDKIPPSLAAVEKRLAPNFPRTLWERISNGTLSQAGAFKNETHGGGLV